MDDVAQDAFLRAFRNLDLLADPAKFGVWLRRITFGVPPARYRVPLTLYHIDGLSHMKVARTLRVPEATVRSLVARARRKLGRIPANAPEVRDMADGSFDVLDVDRTPSPRFLHVLNGDSLRGTLERSDVPGAFATWAEILHEGPVPLASGTDAWREMRARYLAVSGYVSYTEALRTVERWDAQLAAFADCDDVVLWFEHDLFDQLLRRGLERAAISPGSAASTARGVSRGW